MYALMDRVAISFTCHLAQMFFALRPGHSNSYPNAIKKLEQNTGWHLVSLHAAAVVVAARRSKKVREKKSLGFPLFGAISQFPPCKLETVCRQ
jgi:hypothetical protein